MAEEPQPSPKKLKTTSEETRLQPAQRRLDLVVVVAEKKTEMLGQDEDRSSENLVDEEEAQIAKRRRVLLRNLALLRPASSAATPEGVSYDASQAVELSDKEREVFTFLLAVNESFGLKSTLRVAGGWVRDKVLSSQ
jgi:hypothetical protein